jgi:hypothetical protein
MADNLDRLMSEQLRLARLRKCIRTKGGVLQEVVSPEDEKGGEEDDEDLDK